MKFAIASATTAPNTAPILLRGPILSCIKEAHSLGFDAIEWHMRPDLEVNTDEVKAALEETGLSISALASGKMYTEMGLSLLDEDPTRAIQYYFRFIDLASELSTDVIIGLAKGLRQPDESVEEATNKLINPISKLSKYAESKKVRLLLEAINSEESNLFIRAQEIVNFIETNKLSACFIHLDSYHIYKEGANPLSEIEVARDYLAYYHFADGDRSYPKSNQDMDFTGTLKKLNEIGYKGYYSFEYLPGPDGSLAAANGLAYIKSIKF